MPKLSAGFYTKSIRHKSGQLEISYYTLSRSDDVSRQNTVFALDKVKSSASIVEVGFCCAVTYDLDNPIDVLDLYGLVVRPRTEAIYTCSLADLEVYDRYCGENSEQRLKWTWYESTDTWPIGLPWSSTTGPFSVFTIKVNDKVLGQAHCLEFPLKPSDWLQDGKDAVTFSVQGHLFGGGEVSESLIARHAEGGACS